jgi:hypothetical protein
MYESSRQDRIGIVANEQSFGWRASLYFISAFAGSVSPDRPGKRLMKVLDHVYLLP